MAMSLQPQEIAPVPEETERIARAAFPKGPSPNSRVMKGHLKGQDALIIEIIVAFANPRYFGSRHPMMDLLHVLDPGSRQLCTCVLHRKDLYNSNS